MEQLKKNSEMSLIRCVRNYTRRRATMIIITRNIRGIRHEDKTYNLKSFTHFQGKKTRHRQYFKRTQISTDLYVKITIEQNILRLKTTNASL